MIIAMQQNYDTSTPEGKRQAIDEYRRAVTTTPGLSFKAFCDQSGISNYKPLLWWCNGQGISVYDIQRGKERSAKAGEATPTFIQFRPQARSHQSTLQSISITFPDGVNLTLQESGVEDLVSLLITYQSRKQAAGGAETCSR